MMSEEHQKWLKASEFDDIQPAHSAVFQPLWEHPDGARLTTLARMSRVTKQSMSALVDHLERRGYVERVPDPEDARASLVCLTARGRSFVRAIRTFAQEMEANWAARIGDKRLAELRSSLEMLRQSWQGDEE
jgi:DNA-binding MarR family transcriptional regulator